jgi:hypothetical protein
MPRPKKTSTQPKKRIKKFVDKPKPVYPEFLQKFIEEVESKTIFKVKVDQYMEGSPYHVGVLVKKGPRYGCIWMVGYATTREELNLFWTSESYKNWSQNQT